MAPNTYSQRPLLSTDQMNESEKDNYSVVFTACFTNKQYMN